MKGATGRLNAVARRTKDRFAHMERALSLVPEHLRSGLYLEFGVASGKSINFIAAHVPRGATARAAPTASQRPAGHHCMHHGL